MLTGRWQLYERCKGCRRRALAVACQSSPPLHPAAGPASCRSLRPSRMCNPADIRSITDINAVIYNIRDFWCAGRAVIQRCTRCGRVLRALAERLRALVGCRAGGEVGWWARGPRPPPATYMHGMLERGPVPPQAFERCCLHLHGILPTFAGGGRSRRSSAHVRRCWSHQPGWPPPAAAYSPPPPAARRSLARLRQPLVSARRLASLSTPRSRPGAEHDRALLPDPDLRRVPAHAAGRGGGDGPRRHNGQLGGAWRGGWVGGWMGGWVGGSVPTGHGLGLFALLGGEGLGADAGACAGPGSCAAGRPRPGRRLAGWVLGPTWVHAAAPPALPALSWLSAGEELHPRGCRHLPVQRPRPAPR